MKNYKIIKQKIKNKCANALFWLAKKGYISQTSFASFLSPYMLQSKNVKIFMKIEDTEETYNLFKNYSKK